MNLPCTHPAPVFIESKAFRCFVFAVLNLIGLLFAFSAHAASCDPTQQSCAPSENGNTNNGAAKTCSPSPGGDTCGGSGVASQGNTSGTNQGAGNPINIINGNKYQKEVDMPALPGVLGLEIIRHYNSQYALPNEPVGILGHGWRLSYQTTLLDNRVGIQIVQADGTRLIFQRSETDASHCTSTDPAHGVVKISDTPNGKTYIWRWPGNGAAAGRALWFNARGLLVQIAAPTGETVHLQYLPDGRLTRVQDPQGRTLELQHLQDDPTPSVNAKFLGLQTIRSPIGDFSYQYGGGTSNGNTTYAKLVAANLTQVNVPSAGSVIERIYHYEDPKFPTLLTGISVHGSGSDGVVMTRRISNYGYDNWGKAVLSEKADGTEKVTLNRSTPKQTTLTNSLGQTTTYTYADIAGQWRLLASHGVGCAQCGPVNMRYNYDAQGRLIEQTTLNAQGQALATLITTLDAHGRPEKVERVVYTGTQRGPPKWLVRYAYPSVSANEPSVVAWPSVVAGKEHQLKTLYNSAGQPIEVTESGYEPIEGKAIERTTRYRYQTIGQHSLLVAMDGPLPNGPNNSPQDSDITQWEWDRQGRFVTAITLPGGIQQRLTYDDIGRIQRAVSDDGYRRRQTDFRYAPLGMSALQPEQIVETAWLLIHGKPIQTTQQRQHVLSVQIDALGRITQSTDPAGRLIQLGYDSANRLFRLSDAQGYTSQITFDPEGHKKTIALYKPNQHDTPYRAAYQWHDNAGRLIRRLLPDGRMDEWDYPTNGSPLKNPSEQREDNPHTQAKEQLPPNAVVRLDDFGRWVQQQLPAHGRKTAFYDVADHLTALVNADGSGVQYVWDNAGHLLQKTYRNAPSDKTWQTTAHAPSATDHQTTLHYQGSVLKAATDPMQSTQYRHDAMGRVVEETIQLAGLPKPITTRTHYDPDTGLVSARTLADGRVLRIQRSDISQGATPTRLYLQSPWVSRVQDLLDAWLPRNLSSYLGDMMPAQTLASDIRIDPFDGLSSYTSGNGLQTHHQFDIAGRLLEIKTDNVMTQRFRYATGPRIIQQETTRTLTDTPHRTHQTSYAYRNAGQLQVASSSPGPFEVMTSAALLVDESIAPPTPNPQVTRDPLGRTLSDAHYRYTYTPAGQLHTVHKLSGELIATYSYNSLQQRVRKQVAGHSTYYLWQQGQRVAELDEAGQLVAQYLYMAEGSLNMPLAKLQADTTYFIHTDHRAMPLAMTDQNQHIVWQQHAKPWGMTQIQFDDENGFLLLAELNLRLAGQYFDAETGLHDNWHRTYNPSTGHYLQPDPLGYPDGPNPYVYAQGDPVNRADPMGLYQIDMHYYMTFFLALSAGMDYQPARTTALASQFIDDNPMTKPLDDATPITALSSIFKNHQQLLSYQFTLSDSEGNTLKAYDNKNINSVVGNLSPQLMNLQNAAAAAKSPCAKYQFLGEFLHAYGDSFSHRTSNDIPFDAFTFGQGVGHGLSGSEPDYTYNDANVSGTWSTRENRTLAAEKAMFDVLKTYGGGKPSVSWSAIESTLKAFNQIKENGKDENITQKKALLERTLNDMLDKLDIDPRMGDGSLIKLVEFEGPNIPDLKKVFGYSKEVSKSNRENYLSHLKESDYPGTCLPGGTRCKPL